MNNKLKIGIVVIVSLFVIGVFYLKNAKLADSAQEEKTDQKQGNVLLPRMLELGSTTCIPCKMMEEVLEALRHNYKGELQVDFIDVTINVEAGKKYKIQLIPTQIFFDAFGKEIFRHEGFLPEKEIVAKFAELGVKLKSANIADPEHFQDEKVYVPGMISAIFATLSKAVTGSIVIALSAAFIWGVLSILLSPCHLASIPLIVGFINEQKTMTTKHAFFLSFIFSFGILVTIALIGIITALTGHMLGDVGSLTNYIVSFVFLLVGLHLLDIIPMPWSGPGQVKMKRKGMIGALILGLVFGVAIGPCTFAYMAPMLAVTFKTSADHNMLTGICLLILYGIGHCSVIIFAGTFTELIQKYLNWNEKSRGAVIIKKICAILVIIAGFYLIYIA